MGNAYSSSFGKLNGSAVSRSCSTISTPCFPPLNWVAVASDNVCRSEVLLPSTSDVCSYPLDGRPEHGQFTNHLNLKLHFYIWYPPCNTSASSNPLSSSCCCSGREPLPEVCLQSSTGSPADFGVSTPEKQKEGQQQVDLCIHCKKERVKSSKGVVLLIHGYQSHGRFSWLRRWSRPYGVHRDPRICGYKPYDSLEKELPSARETEAGDTPASSTEAAATGASCGTCLGCSGSPQYKGSVVEALNALGFVVAAIDTESQGLSEGWEGRRGGFRCLDDLPIDILQFIHVVRRRLYVLRGAGKERLDGDSPESDLKDTQQKASADKENLLGDTTTPFFLIGSSLGGWSSVRAVQCFNDSQSILRAMPAVAAAATAAESASAEDGEAADARIVAAAAPCLWIKGLVAISPMFDLDAAKGRMWTLTRPVLQQLASWVPHMHVSKNKLEARYITEKEHRQADALYIHQGIRARTALEMLSKAEMPLNPEETKKITETTCKAVLVVHNALDEHCSIKGALEFYKKVTVADKTLLAINAVPPPEVSVHPENQQDELNDKAACYFSQRVCPELREELKRCADVSLAGLDVHHSFASETDGNVVLGKVADWLQKHSSQPTN